MSSNPVQQDSGSANININTGLMAPPPQHLPPPPGKFACAVVAYQCTNINLDPTLYDRMSADEFINFVQERLPIPLDPGSEANLRTLLNDHSDELKIMAPARGLQSNVQPPNPALTTPVAHGPALSHIIEDSPYTPETASSPAFFSVIMDHDENELSPGLGRIFHGPTSSQNVEDGATTPATGSAPEVFSATEDGSITPATSSASELVCATVDGPTMLAPGSALEVVSITEDGTTMLATGSAPEVGSATEDGSTTPAPGSALEMVSATEGGDGNEVMPRAASIVHSSTSSQNIAGYPSGPATASASASASATRPATLARYGNEFIPEAASAPGLVSAVVDRDGNGTQTSTTPASKRVSFDGARDEVMPAAVITPGPVQQVPTATSSNSEAPRRMRRPDTTTTRARPVSGNPRVKKRSRRNASSRYTMEDHWREEALAGRPRPGTDINQGIIFRYGPEPPVVGFESSDSEISTQSGDETDSEMDYETETRATVPPGIDRGSDTEVDENATMEPNADGTLPTVNAASTASTVNEASTAPTINEVITVFTVNEVGTVSMVNEASRGRTPRSRLTRDLRVLTSGRFREQRDDEDSPRARGNSANNRNRQRRNRKVTYRREVDTDDDEPPTVAAQGPSHGRSLHIGNNFATSTTYTYGGLNYGGSVDNITISNVGGIVNNDFRPVNIPAMYNGLRPVNTAVNNYFGPAFRASVPANGRDPSYNQGRGADDPPFRDISRCSQLSTENGDLDGTSATARLFNPAFAPAGTAAEAMANAQRALARQAAEAEQVEREQAPQPSAQETAPTANDPVVKTEPDTEINAPVIKTEPRTEPGDPVIKTEPGTEPQLPPVTTEPTTRPGSPVTASGMTAPAEVRRSHHGSPPPRPPQGQKRSRDDDADDESGDVGGRPRWAFRHTKARKLRPT